MYLHLPDIAWRRCRNCIGKRESERKEEGEEEEKEIIIITKVQQQKFCSKHVLLHIRLYRAKLMFTWFYNQVNGLPICNKPFSFRRIHL